jgi:dUTP pyrophosphatase
VTLVNAPGTIDAGYRGEVKVILLNTDLAKTVSLRRGDRIAQLVVQRVENVTFREVPALPESARGDNGFGSTGGHAAEYTPRVPAER